MKRFFALSVFIIIIASAVSAVDLGIGLYFDYDSYQQIADEEHPFRFPDDSFFTVRVDVPLNRHLGLIAIPGVKFSREETVEMPEEDPVVMLYNIFWNGQAGPVYHIFGYRSFLDPFISAGIGCSGMYSMDRSGFDAWWNQTRLGIYAYAMAGFNLVLDRSFYIGIAVQNNFYTFNPIFHAMILKDLS